MKSITPTKNFHNVNGRIYAQIANGVLRKSEKECDRLRIFGGRSHAIDEDLLSECSRLEISELQIREKADNGAFRVWRISIADVQRHGKIRTLRGIERRTIPLINCELLSGPMEPWYQAERAALLEAEKPVTTKKEISREQGLLFSDEGISAWDRRARHEL